MKIMQVIHRYPPYYRAGSETYTWLLSRELARQGHQVIVFTRVENPFRATYETNTAIEDGVQVITVNRPVAEHSLTAKYLDPEIEQIFKKELLEFDPDIVHIGHLSHLSTNIVKIAREYRYPVIFTLHDYWLMCLRGQLITRSLEPCEGPSVKGCMDCFSLYFRDHDLGHSIIRDYLAHMSEIRDLVDHYIAPSRFLMDMFVKNGLPREKITYIDYGFDFSMFERFQRKPSSKIRFGFTGRIIPTKGVHLLLEAFRRLEESDVELHIYGTIDESAKYLLYEHEGDGRVFFHGEYDYADLPTILASIDVLVVPSIWYENSPLVIHEAFLAGIPVITSNVGGMAELVTNGVNGLLFERGNAEDLTNQMRKLVQDRDLLKQLTPNKNGVMEISDHVRAIVNVYQNILERHGNE